MITFDGKKHAKQIYQKLGNSLAGSIISIIQVGEDAGSSKYIELKTKVANKLGIKVIHEKLQENVSEAEIIQLIQKANNDSSISGIMVQSPLPSHLKLSDIVSRIRSSKDLDGMNYSLSSIVKPAVVESILFAIFEAYNIDPEQNELSLKGKEVVMVNDSIILGKPLALELLNLGATVTITNKYTENLSKYIEQAEIIVSATGVQSLIKNSWLHNSHVCIDAGFPFGDFELNNSDISNLVQELQIKFLTPVPGGIGPLTVAKLFENLGKLKNLK